MSLDRRAARWLAAAVALTGLLLGSATPAFAAGELGVSPDGVHWAATLPGPLFDPAFRWVPGDTESASFYVRDQSADPGLLDVTMLGTSVDDLLATGNLRVSAQVDNGPAVSVNTTGPHTLISQAAVAPGAVRKVTVTVAFDPASTNQDQDRQLDLGFRVSLTQAGSVSPPTASPSGTPTGTGGTGGVSPPTGTGGNPLPNTGTVITPALLLLIAGLLAGGGALVGSVRRSRAVPQERQRFHA